MARDLKVNNFQMRELQGAVKKKKREFIKGRSIFKRLAVCGLTRRPKSTDDKKSTWISLVLAVTLP